MEFRHVPREGVAIFLGLEIHAPHAGEEGEGNKNGRNDGQDAHDFVGPQTDAGEVHFHKARGDITIGLDEVHDLDGVVVTISEVHLRLPADQSAFIVK